MVKKSQAFRPTAMERSARSALFSRRSRPSSRKRFKASRLSLLVKASPPVRVDRDGKHSGCGQRSYGEADVRRSRFFRSRAVAPTCPRTSLRRTCKRAKPRSGNGLTRSRSRRTRYSLSHDGHGRVRIERRIIQRKQEKVAQVFLVVAGGAGHKLAVEVSTILLFVLADPIKETGVARMPLPSSGKPKPLSLQKTHGRSRMPSIRMESRTNWRSGIANARFCPGGLGYPVTGRGIPCNSGLACKATSFCLLASRCGALRASSCLQASSTPPLRGKRARALAVRAQRPRPMKPSLASAGSTARFKLTAKSIPFIGLRVSVRAVQSRRSPRRRSQSVVSKTTVSSLTT